MGTPASCNAYVRFDNEENALKAVLLFDKWIKLAEEGKLPEKSPEEDKSINGDYGISAVSQEKEEITFEVESPRYQNCIWQCENIRDFFQQQPGCQQIEQDVMTCEESVNWYREDQDN